MKKKLTQEEKIARSEEQYRKLYRSGYYIRHSGLSPQGSDRYTLDNYLDNNGDLDIEKLPEDLVNLSYDYNYAGSINEILKGTANIPENKHINISGRIRKNSQTITACRNAIYNHSLVKGIAEMNNMSKDEVMEMIIGTQDTFWDARSDLLDEGFTLKEHGTLERR